MIERPRAAVPDAELRLALDLVRSARLRVGDGRQEAIDALESMDRLLLELVVLPSRCDRTHVTALFARVQWVRSVLLSDDD